MTRKIFPVKCSYVFTDSNGKMVSDCVYEDAKGNDYFNAYKVGGKWGFIDNDGNNITDAIYDTVSLIDNVAIVKNKDRYYMLNNKLETIIPDVFYTFRHIKCNEFNYFIIEDAFAHKAVYLINSDNSYEEIIPFNHDEHPYMEYYSKYIIYSEHEYVNILDLESKEIIHKFEGFAETHMIINMNVLIIVINSCEDTFSSILIAINKYKKDLIIQKTSKFVDLDMFGQYLAHEPLECLITYDEQFYKFYTVKEKDNGSIYFEEIVPELQIVQYYLRTHKDYIIFYDKHGLYYIYSCKNNEYKRVFKGIFPLFLIKALKLDLYIPKNFYKKIWLKNK